MAYLEDYLRVRSDISGEESVFHIKGKIYAMIPGEKSRELFAVEGYSISRVQKAEDGYLLLSKEVLLLQDHRTRQIMRYWRNPFTGMSIPVIHILNDPVNQSFRFEAEMMPYIRQILPSTDFAENRVYHSEIFPFHPSLLPRREYSANVQSEYFQAAEISSYRASHAALADSSKSSVNAEYDWVWISPWLPFMEMADREGQLLFVCQGEKLEGGFAALPAELKSFIVREFEDYSRAPLVWEDSKINPWSYFKSLHEEEIPEEDIR